MAMKNTVPSFALAVTLATAGLCAMVTPAAHAADTNAKAAADKVLATVNGAPITEQMFEFYARQ
ncbi:MAG TPA: hypothetical protein VKA76_13445, partial [Gammaproteobacteria bacterium]|nr:hypothetical protein [Gammaproteobacteria bacterium]